MLDETEALLCQPLPPLPVLAVPFVHCWNHKRPPWIHTLTWVASLHGNWHLCHGPLRQHSGHHYSSQIHTETLFMATHKDSLHGYTQDSLFGYTHRLSSWLHIKTLSTVMHRLSSWLTWTLLRAFFTETFFRDTHRDSIQSYKQTLFIATNTTQTNKSAEWPTFAD